MKTCNYCKLDRPDKLFSEPGDICDKCRAQSEKAGSAPKKLRTLKDLPTWIFDISRNKQDVASASLKSEQDLHEWGIEQVKHIDDEIVGAEMVIAQLSEPNYQVDNFRDEIRQLKRVRTWIGELFNLTEDDLKGGKS